MARPKGSSTKKKAAGLVAALDFIACAITENSPEAWRGCVRFRDGYALAFNGIISAGCKVDEEFAACPQFGFLRRALEKASDTVAFTQIDASKLAITSGKFKALIPCLQPDAIQEISSGFEQIGPIVKESGTTVVEASLLLKAGSMVACDRVLLLEYWHGIDLPPGLVIPKAFVNAVIAAKKKIIGFGYSPEQSMTLHFEDGSWIKTQLFSVGWPDIDFLARGDINRCAPMPEGLFDAIAAVLPFSGDGNVFFNGETISSHEERSIGASFEFACPSGYAYKGQRLLMMKGRASFIEFNAEHKMAFFFSNDPPIRGALAQYNRSQHQPIEPASEVAVPPEFQAPMQQAPQEAQGTPLPVAGAPVPAGWNNAASASPAGAAWGSEASGDPSDDFGSADPANAWKQHTEQPAETGGWTTTKSVAFPG